MFSLSYCFKLFIFGLVVRMSKKFILRGHQLWRHITEIWIRIGQVLQFCIHSISAKYHIFRLHSFEGETFGNFDVLIGHRGVTWLVTMETLSPKYFSNQVLLLSSVSETYLKRKQSYSNKNSKSLSRCLSRTRGICWPLSLKKNPSVEALSYWKRRRHGLRILNS